MENYFQVKNSHMIDHVLNDEVSEFLRGRFASLAEGFAAYEREKSKIEYALYRAIGRVYAFAITSKGSADLIFAYAKRNNVALNSRSNVYAICTKLLFIRDRQKASKYATVMRFAEREGVLPDEDTFAEFIKKRGGLEACLKLSRPEGASPPVTAEKPRPAPEFRSIDPAKLPTIGNLSQEAFQNRPDADSGPYAVVLLRKGEDGQYGILPLAIHEHKIISLCIDVIESENNHNEKP